MFTVDSVFLGFVLLTVSHRDVWAPEWAGILTDIRRAFFVVQHGSVPGWWWFKSWVLLDVHDIDWLTLIGCFSSRLHIYRTGSAPGCSFFGGLQYEY